MGSNARSRRVGVALALILAADAGPAVAASPGPASRASEASAPTAAPVASAAPDAPATSTASPSSTDVAASTAPSSPSQSSTSRPAPALPAAVAPQPTHAQPYPAQPHTLVQPYSTQPYAPVQPYPVQPYAPVQPYPAQPYAPVQPYPAQPYAPAQPYPQPYAPPRAWVPPPQSYAPPPAPARRSDEVQTIVTGASVFGVTYLITAILGAVTADGHLRCTDPGDRPRDCKWYGGVMMIPVVGPFIAIGGTSSEARIVGLVWSGVLQLSGIGLGIAGGVSLARKRRLTADGLRLHRNVHVGTGMRADGVGLQLRLRF